MHIEVPPGTVLIQQVEPGKFHAVYSVDIDDHRWGLAGGGATMYHALHDLECARNKRNHQRYLQKWKDFFKL